MEKYVKGIEGIGQVLREVGLPFSPKTLRSYEKKGLIKGTKNPSGIRIYNEKDIETIIKSLAGIKVFNKFPKKRNV